MNRQRRGVILIAVLSLAATACSAQRPSADPAAARQLRIGLVEYDVLASHAAVLPGDVTLEVTNAGAEAHDLRVDGALQPAATPTLRPGDTATLPLRVAPDQEELVLSCTLPGHRAQGMHTRLAVAPQRQAEAVP